MLFQVYTDGDLEGVGRDGLLELYQKLRDHHVEETAALRAKDRGLILRMAGNIAAGIARNHVSDYGSNYNFDRISEVALGLARALVNKMDER